MSRTGFKAAAILDVTERLVRIRGYNGFSFREVAAQVGIKSASVHYHFPTKAELGAALARRYTDRFLEHLGDPMDRAIRPQALLARYIEAYRHALIEDGLMCLCGMLGAEIAGLPPAVADEAKRFFERNVDWLAAVSSRLAPPGTNDPVDAWRQALVLLATLEGAMIVARALGRTEAFNQIVAGLDQSQAA